jgi:hypothetical protein
VYGFKHGWVRKKTASEVRRPVRWLAVPRVRKVIQLVDEEETLPPYGHGAWTSCLPPSSAKPLIATAGQDTLLTGSVNEHSQTQANILKHPLTA